MEVVRFGEQGRPEKLELTKLRSLLYLVDHNHLIIDNIMLSWFPFYVPFLSYFLIFHLISGYLCSLFSMPKIFSLDLIFIINASLQFWLFAYLSRDTCIL